MRVWVLGWVLVGFAGLGASGQERPKITGISHMCVYTTDAAKAEVFYVHDLGAVKGDDPERADGVRYYFSPMQFVEVVPLPAGMTSINRLDHVAYNVSDAEAMRKYLGAHGVVVPAGVTEMKGGGKYFDVADPEGMKVEFVQVGKKLPEVPLDALSQHIIHVGYIVHDPDVEDKFYQGVLGFRPYWHGGPKEGVTNWMPMQVPDGTDWMELMLTHDAAKTGIPAGMTQQGMGSSDHFSLGVENMEKAVVLLAAGDRMSGRHSPMQLGRDGKWQFNLFDPDETRVELMEFQPSVKPCCSPFLLPSPTE
jgi:catechol 2,3-dioxygenase-like lactoylglutathione lyase family enzyme